MRKNFIIAIVAIIMLPIATMAQLITTSQMITTETSSVLKPIEPGYEQSVELYYMCMPENGYDYFTSGFGAEYIGGYRLNNTLFIGGGIGVYYDFYAADWACCWIYPDYGEQKLVNSTINIPLYAHIRTYIGRGRIQPFFSVSVGGKFASNGTADLYRGSSYMGISYDYSRCSFLAAPAVGVNIRCTNNFAMYLNVACWAQTEPYYDYDKGITHPMKASIKISLGFTF